MRHLLKGLLQSVCAHAAGYSNLKTLQASCNHLYKAESAGSHFAACAGRIDDCRLQSPCHLL